MKIKINTFKNIVFRINNFLLTGSIFCLIFPLNTISSLFFNLLLIVSIISIMLNLYKVKYTKEEQIMFIVLIFISIITFFSATFEATNINLTYLTKWILFNITLWYFFSTLFLRIEKKTYTRIYQNICFLSISFIFAYFLGFNYLIAGGLTFSFINPNLTAIFLFIISVLLLIYKDYTIKRFKKFFLLLQIMMMIYFGLMTDSRNFLLVVTISSFIYVYHQFKKRIHKVENIFYAVFPLIFSYLYFHLLNNPIIINYFSFLIDEGKGLDSRYTIWTKAFNSINENIILGNYYGLGNGTGQFQMHNTHLEVLSSFGIIVLILFLIFNYLLLKNIGVKSFFLGMIFLLGWSESALLLGSSGIFVLVGNVIILSKMERKETEKN